MCGIAAIVWSSSERKNDLVIGAMVEQLCHRGPDATGTVDCGPCELGHTRLSIIDTAGGAQPMRVDSSPALAITFNGEIYNYRELRAELQESGVEFRTKSDTEVLLHAYRKWGETFLDRLRGMFALAIWDSGTRTLLAARDPFGEKPLFFGSTRGGDFVLASELKAIRAAGLIDLTMDRTSVDAFLALGYVPPDRSIYEQIRPLPPAHSLHFREGKVCIRPYWSLPTGTLGIDLHQAAERLDSLVGQAVQRQLVSDVPVGAFLSGGLDSSTIVALAQNASSDPLATFSVGFPPWIDERPYARAVARKYGTDHHELEVSEIPVADLMTRLVDVYDEPFADSSSIPTFLVSEFASRSVKVVLSGDGGDEIFGGYGWYAPLLHSEKGRPSRLKWLVSRLASRALGDRVGSLRNASIGRRLALEGSDLWDRHVYGQSYLHPDQRRRLWRRENDSFESWRPAKAVPSGVTGLRRAFLFDLQNYLPGDILVKVDRASMAHGLETRAPFLDRDLAEFAFSLPTSLKVTERETKISMREAFHGYWPEEIRRRGKHGFGAPYAEWLRRSDVRSLASRVFAREGVLGHVLPGVRSSLSGLGPFERWMLLTLGLWLERNEAAVKR